MLLYGDSGSGKSSLVNAGLIPAVEAEGFRADRIRVQPRAGEELVVERIPMTEDEQSFLPSSFADDDVDSPQSVLAAGELRRQLEALGEEARDHRPLLIFDQFEELITLFEEAPDGPAREEALACQTRIVDALVSLLQDTTLPVKLLFSFREDYLAKVRKLLDRTPELFGQSLRLAPPEIDVLPRLVRGPFEDHPGAFGRELSTALAEQLTEAFRQQKGTGSMNLTEVEIVCLRLWESDDPEGQLEMKEIQGLLEEYLVESLNRFPAELHYAAIALLSQMVTASGARNVAVGDDLIERVRGDETGVPAERLRRALQALESETKLVRRERRRDVELYEISSEFLVPWIRRQRAERLRAREQAASARRQRRLLSALGVAGVLVALMAGVTVFALTQRQEAQEQARSAHARQLDTAAVSLLGTDPGLGLLLATAAARKAPSQEAEDVLRQSLAFFREESILETGGPVTAAHFSRDGSKILVAGEDGRARIYDAKSRSLLRTLRHGAPILDAAFSPNSELVITGGEDGTLKMWGAGSAPTHTLEHGGPVRSTSFSNDGTLIVTAGGERATIWRADGTQTAELPWGKQVTGASFSPDGRRLIVIANDDVARMYDTREGAFIRGFDQGGTVNSAAFSPERDLLVTAGANDSAKIWRVGGRLEHELVGHRGEVLDAAFAPRASRLATVSADGTGRIWNVDTGDPVATIVGHSGLVVRVAFSPDGNFALTSSDDRTSRVSLADSGSGRVQLAGHRDSVTAAEFGPNGTVLTASDDGTARVWDSQVQPELTELASFPSEVADAEYVPQDDAILVTGPRGQATLIDDKGGDVVRSFPVGGRVRAVAASDDGGRIAVTVGRRVRVFRTSGERELALVHPAAVTAVDFAPDGGIVTGNRTGGGSIWSADGELIRSFRGGRGAIAEVAVSPDGDRVALASKDGTVRVVSASSGELELELNGHTDDVTSVAFSPDGRFLLTASRDHDAALWDAEDGGAPLQVFRWHFGSVSDASFSPDGRWIVTAGPKTVGLWEGRAGSDEPVLPNGFGGNRALLTSTVFDPSGQVVLTTAEDGSVRTVVCDVCVRGDQLVELAESRLQQAGRELTPEEREEYGLD